MPDTDCIIRAASIQSGAISGPSKGYAARNTDSGDGLKLDVVDDILAQEIPDLNGRLGGRAEPVAHGAEDEAVDHIAGLERVQMLGSIQVPQHDGAVLATRGAQGTIGRDGNNVDVATMAKVIDAQVRRLRLQVPDLDDTIPTRRHNQGVGSIGREADARDPLGVAGSGSARTIGSREVTLQLTTGVPDLDGLVAATRNNKAVVGRERDGEDLGIVANKADLSLALGEVPQAHRLVRRAGNGKKAVTRQGNVVHKVIVAMKGLLGGGKVFAIASNLPDDRGLV